MPKFIFDLKDIPKKTVLKVLKTAVCLLPKKILNQLFTLVMERIEEKEKVFLSFHSRPKFSRNYGLWPDELRSNNNFAVLIQGQVIKEYDFTLETSKIYKKLFPKSVVILSTWSDENKDYLRLFKNEDIEVVLNNKPQNPGLLNINYQIVSVYAGIQKAKELGAELVLKTRTDQRIYEVSTKEFLCNLVEAFPVVKGYKQKKRIIGLGMATFKYRLSGPSDMLLFGDIEDMLLFWDLNLDNRVISLDEFMAMYCRLKTVKDEATLNYPEVYL